MILASIEIITTVLVSALIGGAAAVVSSLFLKPRVGGVPEDRGRTGNVRSAEEPVAVVYGWTIKGGPLAFINGTETDNKFLHLITLHAGHQVEEIDEIYFNAELVAGAASHVFVHPPHGVWLTSEWNDYIDSIRALAPKDTNVNQQALTESEVGLGADDQAVNAYVKTQNPDHWTDDHRLRGNAWTYVRLEYDAEAFASFIPSVSAMVVGENRVYDPRDGEERWTMNPALIVADILERYVGVPRARIDEAALISSANACDEKVLRADATEEPRYTANGFFRLEGDWEDWITPYVNAMAGALVEIGGIYYVEAGRWVAPEVTITDADLMGPIRRVSAESDYDRANGVKGTYVSPAGFDHATEYPVIRDAAALADDQGFENVLEHDLEMVNSPTQAQRVAHITLQELRNSEQIHCDVTLRKGLDLRTWDNVNYQSTVLGVPLQTYRVINHGLVPSGTGEEGTLAVRLVLKRHDETVYDWDPATQEQAIRNAVTNLPGASVAPTGAQYSWTPNGSSATHEIGEAVVTWADPPKTGFTIEARVTVTYEYRVTGSGDPWTEATHVETVIAVAPGTETATVTLDDEALTDPSGYDFQNHVVDVAEVRTKCGTNNYSSWVVATPA